MDDIRSLGEGRSIDELLENAVEALASLEREAMVAQLFREPALSTATVGLVTATKELLERQDVSQ